MRRRALSVLLCLALLGLTFPSEARGAEGWSVSTSGDLVTATLPASSTTSTSLELANNVSIKPWRSQTLGDVLNAVGFGGGYSQEAVWTGGTGVTVSCPNMLLVNIPGTCFPDGHGGGKVTIPNGLSAELDVSAIESGGSATVEVAPTDDSFQYDIAVSAIGLALEVLSPGPVFGLATRVSALAFRLVRDAAICDAAIKRGDKVAAAYDLRALSMEALTIINDSHVEWGLAGLDAIPAWMGIKLLLDASQIIEALSNLDSHLESGNSATTVTIRYGTPAPAVTVPGGTWISPADGSTQSGTIQAAAHAYPSKAGDPAIDHVNFTVWWPELGPKSGQWKTACSVTPPTSGDEYDCAFDPGTLGAPVGQMWLSFDVYDKSGGFNRAPNGERTVTWGQPDVVVANGWQTYQGDGYVVDYPGAAQSLQIPSSTTYGLYSGSASYYQGGPNSNPQVVYMVEHLAFPISLNTSGVDYLAYIKTLLSYYSSYSSDVVVNQRDVTVDGHRGLDFSMEGSGTYAECEILLTGSDMYLLMAAHYTSDTTLDANRFFGSFHLR
jgi:hypothetical protein